MSYVRISSSRFQSKELRAHRLLQDAEIHDVWAFDLPTGSGCTVSDLRRIVGDFNPLGATIGVRLLFAVRRAIGMLFGFDRPPRDPDPLYIDRITEEDRVRSVEPPGTAKKGFVTLYVFDDEAADEISNRTVHAVSVMAMEPTEGEGYTVYWAIYLRRSSSAYMRLIDPFRHRVVYPGVIDRIRRAWLDRYPQQVHRIENQTRPNIAEHGE